MKYKVIYTDDCGSQRTVKTLNTHEDAVNCGYDYIDDNSDTYGDSEEDVKTSLRQRDYYIIGYGPESIEIVEV